MTPPVRVLELRAVRGTGGGPEKTILLGTARTDPARFAITVCYIRDARDDVFGIDRLAATLPIEYVELVERHSFDPSILSRLVRLVRDREIDIVHAHDYKANLLAWLVSLRTRAIPLSTVHGWTGHSAREKWIYYPADKRVLAKFPRLIAVSSDVRQELLRAGAHPDRVTTVLNGIDAERFQRNPGRQRAVRQALSISEHAVVVGAVGRLEPQKRFDVLIDAIAELRPSVPGLGLVLVGDGSLRDELTARVAQRGLDDACLMLGHRTDVADLHHAFDLFVQSSDYEGTPNAVLEAMAMETPIVATSAGGTAEIARDGLESVILQPGRKDDLIAAMRAALSDIDAARTRARAARLRVETELSFATRMARVEQVYVDLINARLGAGMGSAVAART